MLSPHAEKWGDRSTPVTAHAIQYVCLSDDVEWNVYLICTYIRNTVWQHNILVMLLCINTSDIDVMIIMYKWCQQRWSHVPH